MHIYKKKPPVYRLHIQDADENLVWWENKLGHRLPQKREQDFLSSEKITFADMEYENLEDLVSKAHLRDMLHSQRALEITDKYARYMLLFSAKACTNPTEVFMKAPHYLIHLICIENGKIHILTINADSNKCTVMHDAKAIPHSMLNMIVSHAQHLFSDEYEVIRETVLF